MNIDERREALAQAGYNVLNLDEVDIELDLLTDVPSRAYVASVRDAGIEATRGEVRDPPLEELAQRLYGDARYVFATKGRSAEDAMAAVFGRDGGVVVTHGLFVTTGMAFKRQGMSIEIAPRAGDGRADLDLGWLADRMARGGVDIVCLEPCNNQLAGWPLHLDNVAAIRDLCRRHGAALLLDATRVLSNGVGLGGSVLDHARALLAMADAFVISCAKELLAPYGSLVAVRDASLRPRLFNHFFEMGTMLEPLDARVRLARGMQYVLDDPSIISARHDQVLLLADALRAEAIDIVEPVGGHAVYVDASALAEGHGPMHARALEGLLYEHGGVRSMIFPNAHLGRTLLRLPLTVARFSDEQVRMIARGVRGLFDHAGEAPSLALQPGDALHPLLSKFARTSAAPGRSGDQ